MRTTRAIGFWLGLLAAAAPAAAEWTLAEDAGSYAGRQLLSQASADRIADEYASKEVAPVISFFCADGADTIAMQIDWRRFISSFKTEAGFKIDDGSAEWFKLDIDSSNKITTATPADTAALIEMSHAGSVLQVEIAPYSEPSVFVTFDVATLAEQLSRLRDTC